MAKEIITLQFGNYSNFVGTHFWNIENQASASAVLANHPAELNRNVLFRHHAGKNRSLISTPRLVAFDFAGALGATKLSRNESAQREAAMSAAQGIWGGGIDRVERGTRQAAQVEIDSNCLKCESPLITGSRFCMSCGTKVDTGGAEIQRGRGEETKAKESQGREVDEEWEREMEAGVEYWPSFLQGPLHSKSVCLLSGFHHRVSPFDYFSQGSEFLSTRTDEVDEMLDRVRYFAEECDYLQGVHCFVDIDSGWGGFAASYLAEFRDDYGSNLPVVTFGSRPFQPVVHDVDQAEFIEARRVVNSTTALLQLSALSSLYIPLSAAPLAIESPYVKFQNNNSLHTSAILGAAIHTATTPYRLKQNPITMTDFVCGLARQRSLNMMDMSVSCPISSSDALFTPQADSRQSRRDQTPAGEGVTEKSPVLKIGLSQGMLEKKPSRSSSGSMHSEYEEYTHRQGEKKEISDTKSKKLLSKWIVLRGSNEIDEEVSKQARKLRQPPPSSGCVERMLLNLEADPCRARNVSALLHSLSVPQRFPHRIFPENKTSLPVLSEMFFDQGVHDALKTQSLAFDSAMRNRALRAQFEKHHLGTTEWKEFSEQMRGLTQDSDLTEL